MRYIEAVCTDAGCEAWLPSMSVWASASLADQAGVEMGVAQMADSHATASGHVVELRTVFRRG